MEFVLKKSEHSIGPVYLLSKEFEKSEHSIGPVYLLSKDFEKSGEVMYGIPV